MTPTGTPFPGWSRGTPFDPAAGEPGSRQMHEFCIKRWRGFGLRGLQMN
jgi:hypothetical protein